MPRPSRFRAILKVYAYSKCETCRKALKFLRERNIPFEESAIRETPPTVAELKRMLGARGNIRKLFNPSGADYRALRLGETLSKISEAKALGLLAKIWLSAPSSQATVSILRDSTRLSGKLLWLGCGENKKSLSESQINAATDQQTAWIYIADLTCSFVWALLASGEAGDRVCSKETKSCLEQGLAWFHAVPC
jgi:Spx/MgsR family transcriptional regulator